MLRRDSDLEEKENQAAGQAYLYTNDKLPCLVRHGAELEDLPQADLDPAEYYQVNARNALRHLTYGTPLFKGSLFHWSNLKLAWLNFKALFLKRDKQLLAALRFEMKIIFQKAYQISKHCDPETEKRLEIFISTLLSNFPFMDPEEGEEVLLPQKINNEWRQVKYKFNKIDLSPKKGFWAKIIEDEDRIYAYGLKPEEPDADPYLLLMGTTYFSGQGSGLSLLGDLTAGQSVGERHDLTDLEKWIVRHRNIKITGHSQGGTMAMIVAAKYPEYVRRSYSLNPAALHQATLAKLLPLWQAPREHNPELWVFTQIGDPVFIFGDGFLPGTRIFRVNHPDSTKASQLAAHAHHYSGRKSANSTELVDYQSELNSNKRKFFNDLKAVADLTVGPLLSLNLAYSIAKRKIKRFCSRHAKALKALLFVAALTACVALMATGVLAPVAFIASGLIAPLAPVSVLAYAGLTVAAIAASVATAYLVPKLTEFAVNLVQVAVGLAVACAVGVTLALSGIVAGIRVLKRSCFGSGPAVRDQARAPEPCNESTRLSLTCLGGTVQVQSEAKAAPVVKQGLKRSYSESDLSKLSFMAAEQSQGQAAAEGKLTATVKKSLPRTP